MGILSTLLLAPISGPTKGTMWIASKIAEAAEAQHNDPAALRAELAAAEAKLISGEMSEDDYDVLETELLTRMRMIPS